MYGSFIQFHCSARLHFQTYHMHRREQTCKPCGGFCHSYGRERPEQGQVTWCRETFYFGGHFVTEIFHHTNDNVFWLCTRGTHSSCLVTLYIMMIRRLLSLYLSKRHPVPIYSYLPLLSLLTLEISWLPSLGELATISQWLGKSIGEYTVAKGILLQGCFRGRERGGIHPHALVYIWPPSKFCILI